MDDLSKIEFHRRGYGMLADSKDKDPGAPVCFPRSEGGKIFTGSCNCKESQKNSSCRHFSELTNLALEINKKHGSRSLGEVFAESMWYRLGCLLSEGDPTLSSAVKVSQLPLPTGNAYQFVSKQGAPLARIPGDSGAPLRFAERAGLLPQKPNTINRAGLIQKLANHLSTEEERQLNKAGALTRRQAAEQSFWGRLAYHAYREYRKDITFHPAIEEESGDFILKCFSLNNPVLELTIPRSRVRKTLAFLHAEFPGQSDLEIHPIPLKSIFRITQQTEIDLEVRPAIQVLQASGEAKFIESKDFAKFRYGDLVYIKEMKVLAELERPDAARRFSAPISMHLKKSMLPAFLDEHRAEIGQGSIVLDGPLQNISVIRDFDRMEIALDAIKRSWYWLSVRYGFGNDSVSLADILLARREGKPYLEVADSWVDVNSEVFDALENIAKQEENADGKKVRFSAVDLLRLMSSFGKPVHVTGNEGRAKILKRLLSLSPAKSWKAPKGLTTPLRPYQAKGVDWLRFLFENRLGGLLCDDMGLGKTHQAMALMVWLKEKQRLKEPFLVVCPTTVISHWRNKIRDHAPGLTAAVYHGGNRSLDELPKKSNVILTSYGIIRNDIVALREIPFSLVVFDEIQNLKNRDTLSFQAASLLQAQMRIGLTGTPIENSLTDLKSLFDLVLPGYLGSGREFAARYAVLESAGDAAFSATRNLRRQIAPFTLRRMKSDVLEELPEKIMDVRTCQLSEMQVKLYREALAAKGAHLIEQLESDSRQLPYIHIFALLNLLKRICDHPALALNKIEDYQSFESGKWDMFQELLFETLDSGQKIIIFTQYLGMIDMMERLLKTLEVGFVTLTGSSQNRGEIVRRFNEDRDCRIFLGSLKAGGAGIDLTGGSTVLHYDRWWNAAREDQATDRAHRIGQKQAVQVFKLVTEGTLEEKISAIIERKRRLMNETIQTDDPQLSKIFTREELIDLLHGI